VVSLALPLQRGPQYNRSKMSEGKKAWISGCCKLRQYTCKCSATDVRHCLHHRDCRGAPQYNWSKMSEGKKAWISVVVATGCCLISIFVGIPLLKKKVQRDIVEQEERRM